MITHIVLFWLKQDVTTEQVSFFEKKLEGLEKIQSVSSYSYGKPSDTPKRPVIDDTYSYGINVLLEDMNAHDTYQVDPIHKDFIESCSPLWEKVKIYDFG